MGRTCPDPRSPKHNLSASSFGAYELLLTVRIPLQTRHPAAWEEARKKEAARKEKVLAPTGPLVGMRGPSQDGGGV